MCFFIDSRFRRQGLTEKLLEAAVAFASRQGADVVEGYPVEAGARSYTYMGSPQTFERASFEDVTPARNAGSCGANYDNVHSRPMEAFAALLH